jgi:dTDP-glucose 4,6-dehydratase
MVLERGRVGESYNIGSSTERSNLQLTGEICELLDELAPRAEPHASRISFVSDRPGHDWRYAIDASRIRGELGWAPGESFHDALHRTVAWYLNNSAWCQRVSTGLYRRRRTSGGTAAGTETTQA